MEVMLIKTCLDCGLALALNNFYNGTGLFGKHVYCKTCMKARSRRHYARLTSRGIPAHPHKDKARDLYVVSREGLPGFKVGSSKKLDNRMYALKWRYKTNIVQHAVFRELGYLESDVHFLLRESRLPGKEREVFDVPLNRVLSAIARLVEG